MTSIFVECKNWTNKVEPKSLRDFEGKLASHGTARLGFFIGVNGFTKGCKSYLLRLSRDKKKIILIDGNKIKQLLESPNKDYLGWLEKCVGESLLL